MKKELIYLDYNATAPIMAVAVSAIEEALSYPANPSSIHQLGRRARQQLQEAREVVAEAVSGWPNEVIFTASGSEANNMALRAVPNRPLLVGATEHSSISESAKWLGGDSLPVDGNGVIDRDVLKSKLKALGKPAFISIMLANNETGVIQPIAELAALAREYDALFHCDAIQALGKMPIDFGALGVDMLTLSAHKMGGPVGVGALIVRNNLPITPFIIGGGQELGRRAGTENLPAIMGFAAALRHCNKDWIAPVTDQIHHFEKMVHDIAPDAIIVGHRAARLPHVSCVIMPQVKSDTQLMTFDLEKICLSAGSACASGRIEPSHVLQAMGFHKNVANCAIRISAGWNSKPEEIARFAEIWKKTYLRLAKKAA